MQTLSQNSFGAGTGKIWLDNVTCTGSERLLKNCTASFSGNNSCTHAQDAGVKCPQGRNNKLCITIFYSVFIKVVLKVM